MWKKFTFTSEPVHYSICRAPVLHMQKIGESVEVIIHMKETDSEVIQKTIKL